MVDWLRLPLPDMEGVWLELREPPGLALPLVHWDTVPVRVTETVGEVLRVRLPLAQRVDVTLPVPLRQPEGEVVPLRLCASTGLAHSSRTHSRDRKLNIEALCSLWRFKLV